MTMSTEPDPPASDSVMFDQLGSTTSPAGLSHGESPRLAFEDFYRADYRNVLGLAFVLTGNRYVAEETAQEAFTAAYRKWSTIAAYDSPGAWVRRVTCNQAASVVRRRMREAKALLRLSKRTASEPLDNASEDFWDVVRRLPARQAQVTALKYLEDLSVAQIADVLDCSEGSVKTHLSRARLAVARDLQLEVTGNE